MKSEVYSLRLSPALKAELQRAARRRKMRVSTVLEAAAREWLERNAADAKDDEEQKQIHAAMARYFGAFASGHRRRSEMVSELVRKKLEKKYGRRRLG
ncbi:MAG TPA: hypothetical protein VKP58_12705 [Candidatus Acidoferrum sp.]|nr:hypothetical protein [Candidatus Acidoferrum sp.]